MGGGESKNATFAVMPFFEQPLTKYAFVSFADDTMSHILDTRLYTIDLKAACSSNKQFH